MHDLIMHAGECYPMFIMGDRWSRDRDVTWHTTLGNRSKILVTLIYMLVIARECDLSAGRMRCIAIA